MVDLVRFRNSIENNDFFRLQYLKIKLTDNCNSRCKGCDFWKITKKTALQFDVIERIIKEGVNLGLSELHLSGGEPTTRDDLEEIVGLASSFSVKTRLLTNGILLNGNRLEQLLKKGLACITFSLDSANPTQNDYLRGVDGAHTCAIENYKLANQLKSKFDFQLGINCVVSTHNLSSLDNIVILAKTLGADWIRLDPFDKHQQTLHGRTSSEDEVFKMHELIMYNQNMKPRLFYIHNTTGQVIFPESLNLFGKTTDELEYSTKGIYPCNYDQKKICFSPFIHLTIYPDGSTMPCCKIPLSYKLIGNIHNSSLKELAQNNISNQYRSLVKSGNLNICQGCTMRDFDNNKIYEQFSNINWFPKVQ
jgi:radical SAM protein with 4Fe4S-binding SPASM domain